MNRRLFLQLPLAVSALTATAQNASPGKSSKRPKKGIKVAANKDRFQEEMLIMGGKFDCKVSSKDTAGDLLIYDTVRQEKGGPGVHLHHAQDEWFYVIKGDFIVKVGDETFTLTAGDTAFAPRTIPHAFAKTSEGEGQMLILFQPAGSMEDFFLQMAKISKGIPKDMEKTMKELFVTHGMEIVGPPLKY
ncbi:MAG TPA: cupin domain-containing protein [Chitinophagaceae bacterium]